MAKSEICKNCCPDGGALFSIDFGCWPHHATGEMMQDDAWVKVCNNCGHYKPKRRIKRLSFDEVMAEPNDVRLRNKKQRARFHAFSENGAWAEYCKITDAYAAECEARGITKYPLLMHKWMNTYHYDKLTDHENELTAREADHHISSLKEQVARAQQMLDQGFSDLEAA